MSIAVPPFYLSIFHISQYRRTQGRLVRHVVLAALWILVVAICQGLFRTAEEQMGVLLAGVSVISLAMATGWSAYRFIQYPPVADFLIDVQVEASKVSWCSWSELRRTTMIVLAVMVVFSAFLFGCDMAWQFVLRSLSILRM